MIDEKQYECVIPEFIKAINDIGEYGFEKYGKDSFQARRVLGDTSRNGMERCQTATIAKHSREHFDAYEAGIPHDKFGTMLHQLAAVAFNAMMEAYFAGLAGGAITENKPSGVELIAKERERQIHDEGWTADHDQEHRHAELSGAGTCYAIAARKQLLKVRSNKEIADEPAPSTWPWDRFWWKPSEDPIRNLVKAGALIAAEIDRLQRAK